MSFFKYEEGYGLHEAPNFVLNANYELRAVNEEDKQKEIDGWKWFDTEQEAIAYFNIGGEE